LTTVALTAMYMPAAAENAIPVAPAESCLMKLERHEQLRHAADRARDRERQGGAEHPGLPRRDADEAAERVVVGAPAGRARRRGLSPEKHRDHRGEHVVGRLLNDRSGPKTSCYEQRFGSLRPRHPRDAGRPEDAEREAKCSRHEQERRRQSEPIGDHSPDCGTGHHPHRRTGRDRAEAG
jgi:hypothetical protein